MKRYILKIILFFAIVAGIDFCAGWSGDYLQAHAKGGAAKRTNGLVMIDYHDIVIFGSSRAHHHYDTPFLSDILGLDVYNAGYDGNGVVLACGLLEMILERYHPKLIIFDVEPAFDIEVYSNDNAHKRYLSLLKPYYKHEKVGEIIYDVSPEEWYKVHSGLLRYNSSFVSLLIYNFKRKDIEIRGYAPLSGSYSIEPKKGQKNEIELDTFKLAYVEKLIQISRTHQVPIVFVGSPKLGMTSSAPLKPVIEICDNYHVQFLDYYADEEFMQHKEWFKEPMHLNADGAKLFSERLVPEIKKLLQ